MIPLSPRVGLAALVLLSTPAAGQRATRRVSRAADIAAGGWHRLGDLVSSLMPGSVATVDGFNDALTSGRVPFAGLSAPGSPQWTVRLDGQRIPVAVDGMWILDQLPVAMTQVDSVVVFTGSSIVDGHASLLGTIDVYTRRPSPGLSGVGDYQHGDESGDPGPYRYTPRATPNVEKLGPFTSGAAAYSHGGWSLDGEARYSSLNITDTSISRRFPTTFGSLQSDVNSSGGSGVLTTSLLGGTQYTIGGRGRFTGLLWVPSARLDSQVRVVTTQGGSSGDFLFGKTRVRYGVVAMSLARAGIHPSAAAEITGNDRGFDDLFAEVTIPNSPIAIGAGHTWIWNSDVPNFGLLEQVTAQRLWVDLFGSSTSRGVTVSAERAGNQIAPSASGWITTNVRDRYEVTTSLSSIQRVATGDDGVFDQEFSSEVIGNATGSGSVPDVKPRNTRITEARLELADQSRVAFTPSVDARFVYTSNWQLHPDIQSGVHRMQVLIVGAGLETKPTARVSASVRGEATAFDAADSAMSSAMRSTPAASIRADVSTIVMTNYRLSASGRFTTSTTWPSESIFDETDALPSLRRIDVSANKPFWHDRIRAQLVVRNLLAQDERYHPVGASWNFRTHLAITVALPPYTSAMTKP